MSTKHKATTKKLGSVVQTWAVQMCHGCRASAAATELNMCGKDIKSANMGSPDMGSTSRASTRHPLPRGGKQSKGRGRKKEKRR
jgi:hypothetical protein